MSVPSPRDAGEHHEVVIVGAGISGLATAWHLRDRDVLVLEESGRAGGRICSERREDTWLNFGAHGFGGGATATGRLLAELGVTALPLSGRPMAVAAGGRLVSGSVYRYPLRLPLSSSSRTALARAGLRLRGDVMRYRRARVPLPGETPAARQARLLAFMDGVSFAERLGRLPPDVDALFRCLVTRSSAEPEELAAGCGIGYCNLLWPDGAARSQGIVGGPGSLVDALAAGVPRVELEAPVTRVACDDDGVRVDVGGTRGRRTVTAGSCVLAVPAPVAAEVAAGLPAETLAALRAVRYGPYIVGAFLVRRDAPLPWEDVYAIATPGRSFSVIYGIGNVQLHPSQPRPEYTSIMVYSAAAQTRRLMDEDDTSIASRYRADLGALFPGAGRHVVDVAVRRWPRGMPFSQVGRGRLQAPLTRPLGRVHLAADYLGTTRSVESCVEAAAEVAARIREQLAPGRCRPEGTTGSPPSLTCRRSSRTGARSSR